MLEARKNGELYSPDKIYGICASYIRKHSPEINIFSDHQNTCLHKVLVGEMKKLSSLGVSVKEKRQMEPITVQEEDALGEKVILGEHDPFKLYLIHYYSSAESILPFKVSGMHREYIHK